MIKQVVVNKKPENKKLIKKLTKLYKFKRVMISAYNSLVNKIIERGYKDLLDALTKIDKKREKS